MNKIVKLALILFLVSAIVAGVLGGIYVVTKPTIDANNAATTAKAYSEVLPEGVAADPTASEAIGETVDNSGNSVTLVSVTPADDGKTYVVETSAVGSQGTISMAVGVDSETGTCTGIAIIASSETSGLGAEASKPFFKDQLVGCDTTAIHITKQGGTVEAITGATITSKAVTNSAAAAIDYVMNMG